jgi:hypothetical protein
VAIEPRVGTSAAYTAPGRTLDDGETLLQHAPMRGLVVVFLTLLVASGAAAQDDTDADGGGGGGGEETSDTATSTESSTATEASREGATDGTGDDAQGEDVVASFGSAIGEPSLSAGEEAPQSAQHRLAWREEWPRYSFDEAVLSLGLGALLLAAELLPTATTRPNWSDVNALDGAAHDGLRLQLPEQRESARVAGDVLMWIDLGIPYVIDALFAAGIGDGSWDTAAQMGLISIEANIVSLVVWRVTALLARRERPIAHDNAALCAANPMAPECQQSTQSFFSNTAVNAFTGAALTCLHHTTMPVFGDEGADATMCVGSLTIASIAGLLRVMSNYEYLTDVVTGAVVGLVSGWLLPWLLHYQGGARPELRPALAVVPLPMIGPNDTYGLDLVGRF